MQERKPGARRAVGGNPALNACLSCYVAGHFPERSCTLFVLFSAKREEEATSPAPIMKARPVLDHGSGKEELKQVVCWKRQLPQTC